MVLSGDETLASWLRGRVSEGELNAIEEERQRLRRAFREPVGYVINGARLREAWRIAGEVQVRRRRKTAVGRSALSWLERMSTHPVWGVPVLAAVLYLIYQFVGVFGAGTLVDLLETRLFGQWINPGSIWLADRLIPWSFLRDLLVGPYGVVTMALTYSLALILPIVGTFFIAFGILEDSGYLPRFAVMVNRWLKGIGLNGKAVLPLVLGLGCATMATLTTRILETRKERLIAILLLALGIPCSAQLTVILAMLGSISLVAMGIWIGVVLGVVLLVGALASRLLPGRGSDFVLELPPLRVPQPKNILIKTAARIEWYLKEAVPLFVLGTLILFIVDRLQVLGWLERTAAPILTGWLGLPKESAAAFIIGFLRRDFGAAGLYRMSEAGQLDAVQALVAVVTITLFIPCIANFFMIARERGWRTAGIIAAFIFPMALLVGATLNWVLRALAVTL
jgi:ferrous iron transport protein B